MHAYFNLEERKNIEDHKIPLVRMLAVLQSPQLISQGCGVDSVACTIPRNLEEGVVSPLL